MRVVLLDCPADCLENEAWSGVDPAIRVDRFASSTLFELLERGRPADVLVTFGIPLRREVLDYVTRPHHIVVPAGRRAALIEEPIAQQLGLEIHELPGVPDRCEWIATLLELLDRIRGPR